MYFKWRLKTKNGAKASNTWGIWSQGLQLSLIATYVFQNILIIRNCRFQSGSDRSSNSGMPTRALYSKEGDKSSTRKNFEFPKSMKEAALQALLAYWNVPGTGFFGTYLASGNSCSELQLQCPANSGEQYTLKTHLYADPELRNNFPPFHKTVRTLLSNYQQVTMYNRRDKSRKQRLDLYSWLEKKVF